MKRGRRHRWSATCLRLEEAIPGSGITDDDLNLQEVPEPPAIPKEMMIPEPSAVPADLTAPTPAVPIDNSSPNTSIEASWMTRAQARTLLLTVPAPRGQIVDRHGYCLAYNKVGFHQSIQFPRWDDPSDTKILNYAHQRINFLNARSPETPWEIEDKKILEHYKHRRWIPLINPRLIKESNWTEVQEGMIQGIKLQPTYYRSYPHGNMAAHFMGYVSKKYRTLPTGPISIGEPITIELVGRAGIEKKFDDYLIGKPGEINVIFDADGNKLSEDVRRPPEEGNHVVLTLEREFQEIAEKVLRSRTKAGAMVIMDVWDGDIHCDGLTPVLRSQQLRSGNFPGGLSGVARR